MEDSQKRAQLKYREKIRQFCLALNIYADADVIAKLDAVPCKQGYIKQLIRDDISR